MGEVAKVGWLGGGGSLSQGLGCSILKEGTARSEPPLLGGMRCKSISDAVTQEWLLLVPSSPCVRKGKFTASLAWREPFAGKSNGIREGVKVKPKGWRPPRLLPAVEAAEKQAVRVHGASLTPTGFLHLQRCSHFISRCLCFWLSYLGRASYVGKSVP